MLKGDALLAKHKEVESLSESEQARACGYVSAKKDGGDRINYTGFYKALLLAQGTRFGPNATAARTGGPRLSFVATTQFNGNLLVGKSYMSQLGAVPGSQYRITFAKNGVLRLVPIGNTDSDKDNPEAGTATATATEAVMAPVAPTTEEEEDDTEEQDSEEQDSEEGDGLGDGGEPEEQEEATSTAPAPALGAPALVVPMLDPALAAAA